MTLVPLDIPPGVYRNGTDLQSQGRWRDSNLIRWIDGTMRPMRGWRVKSATAAAAKVRGMLSWISNNNSRYIAGGTYNKLYIWSAAGVRRDITPTSFTAGREDASVFTGFGGSAFGSFTYGTTRPTDSSRIQAATSWALDTFGENLVGCTPDDGKIYEWGLDTGVVAAAVANAPEGNRSLVVTGERFLMALGAGSNPRKVQWCDREDNTVWNAAATNEAGDIELDTAGQVLAGLNVRGQTMIFTTIDAHTATYIGPPLVYGFERVGSACGLISQGAAVTVDQGAYWMGPRAFHLYSGGAVQDVSCDVSDYIFNDINRTQVSKVFGVANSSHGEITWFYPSGASTENDRYVTFNYIEGHWSIGTLDRTAGVDRGAFQQPIWAKASDAHIYEHDIGVIYDGAVPFAETGPIMIATGDAVASVVGMLPDEQTQGDVNVTFKTRFFPNGTERDYGPYAMSNPTSMRFTGRQLRMRVSAVNGVDWRVGVNRLDIVPGGRR